ncbi:MAG: metallophosphoesterase family protein [Candidatus Hydrothermarchaeota archaeon]|nr:metallophosphoesterase family protein [Candidatus Hydrothermarchaeota archaeon]
MKVGIIIFISLLLVGMYITASALKPRPMKAEIVRSAESAGEQVVVGVISDTHIPSRAGKLPKEVFEIFKGVERIIHAGDFVSAKVLGELEKIAPATAGRNTFVLAHASDSCARKHGFYRAQRKAAEN